GRSAVARRPRRWRPSGPGSGSPARRHACGRWTIEMIVRGAAPAVLVPLALLLLLTLPVLLPATAAQTQLPKQVTLATNPPGTVYYSVASGLAKVVSAHPGYQMRVQPYTEPTPTLPPLT